jgi:hypothetical protein
MGHVSWVMEWMVIEGIFFSPERFGFGGADVVDVHDAEREIHQASDLPEK